MQYSVLSYPIISIILLLVLSLGDLVLGYFAKKSYERYTSNFIVYEAAPSGSPGAKENELTRIGLKLLPVLVVFLIWLIAASSGIVASMRLYHAILGFALTIYLIIDLRYLETILIGDLVKNRKELLSGRLLIGHGFSLGQSAIQLFTLTVILFTVFLFAWEPFSLGAALAPLSLLIRNLVLLKS